MLPTLRIWRPASKVRRLRDLHADDGAYAEYQRWVAAGRPDAADHEPADTAGPPA